MSIETVRIIKLDPYHKVYGLLVPTVAQKLMETAQAIGELDATVPLIMARLWAKDPTVLILAAINSSGQVKGFCAAVYDGQKYVTVVQPRLEEPTENDAVAEMIEFVESWAISLKATDLTLVTRKLDSKWLKKYGFELNRYVLRKTLEG